MFCYKDFDKIGFIGISFVKCFCLLIAMFFSLGVEGQNNFGEIGTYWNYEHFPHDGNGYGWDRVEIIGDSLYNGTVHKVLHRTFYRKQTLPPLEESWGSGFFGLLRISNDSVFHEDKLLIPFGMQIGDTVFVYGDMGNFALGLSVENIETTAISGSNYKRYFGQKLCFSEFDTIAYEPFEAIEGIGAVGFDFFSWNLDGCLIGGGAHMLSCYKNGDFTFPEGADCEPLVLSVENPKATKISIKLFPNPSSHYLNISSDVKYISLVEIFNLNGRLMARKKGFNGSAAVDISDFQCGYYILKTIIAGQVQINAFIKN